MVQKEVMKKTKIYALIGLLLAIILVAMIYTYGPTQKILPASPLSQTSAVSLQKFTSYADLQNYLSQKSSSNFYNSYYTVYGGQTPMPEPAAAPTAAAETSSSTAQAATNDYSTTNVQVAGVDESDIVKTDG